MYSVLYSPIVVSADPLSTASPTVPTYGLSPRQDKCLCEMYCGVMGEMRHRNDGSYRQAGGLGGRGMLRRAVARSTRAVSLLSEHSQPGINPA